MPSCNNKQENNFLAPVVEREQDGSVFPCLCLVTLRSNHSTEMNSNEEDTAALVKLIDAMLEEPLPVRKCQAYMVAYVNKMTTIDVGTVQVVTRSSNDNRFAACDSSRSSNTVDGGTNVSTQSSHHPRTVHDNNNVMRSIEKIDLVKENGGEVVQCIMDSLKQFISESFQKPVTMSSQLNVDVRTVQLPKSVNSCVIGHNESNNPHLMPECPAAAVVSASACEPRNPTDVPDMPKQSDDDVGHTGNSSIKDSGSVSCQVSGRESGGESLDAGQALAGTERAVEDAITEPVIKTEFVPVEANGTVGRKPWRRGRKKRAKNLPLLELVLCRYCNIWFRKSRLANHLRVRHHMERRAECENCHDDDQQQQQGPFLRRQTKYHECNICSSGGGQDTSRRIVLKERRYGPRRTSPLKYFFRKRQTGSRKFACSLCNLFFNNKGSYEIHNAEAHFNRKYVCEVCGKVYFSSWSLDGHMRRRHGGDHHHHQCEVCGETFAESFLLHKHYVDGHDDDDDMVGGAFRCDQCPKGFGDRLTLRDHRRLIHEVIERKTVPKPGTGDEPVRCEPCVVVLTKMTRKLMARYL